MKKSINPIYRLLAGIFLINIFLPCQAENLPPLKVGDKVPDLSLGEILNFRGKSKVSIADFKGKVLILDFWSIWCPSCMEQFPKIEKLQEQFKNKIFILPVGFDGYQEGSVKKYIMKRKGTPRQMNLPTTIQKITDTILAKYFPFKQLPHLVWINEEGRLVGLTNYIGLTVENIKRIIKGYPVIVEKSVETKHLNPDGNFLIARNLPDGTRSYGSAFSTFIDSLKIPRWRFDLQFDSTIVRLVGVNKPVKEYYHEAYQFLSRKSGTNFDSKKIVCEKDGEIFYAPFDIKDMQLLNLENRFCYELVLPGYCSLDAAVNMMIKDLDRFFDIESVEEKREIKCLALVETNNAKRFTSTLHDSIQASFSTDSICYQRRYINYTMGNFLKELNDFISTPYLIINETGFDGKINMTLTDDDKDCESLKKSLAKYDLDLVEVTRAIEVLVLHKK